MKLQRDDRVFLLLFACFMAWFFVATVTDFLIDLLALLWWLIVAGSTIFLSHWLCQGFLKIKLFVEQLRQARQQTALNEAHILEIQARAFQATVVTCTIKSGETLFSNLPLQEHRPHSYILKAGDALWLSKAMPPGNLIEGQPLPTQGQSSPLLPDGQEYSPDPEWIHRVFTPELCHLLLIGARNSGKSTLFNRLLVEFANFWPVCEIVLLDPMYNEVDSGWLTPTGLSVELHKADADSFVSHLTKFYESHQRVANLVEESRQGHPRRILAIDETPTLLKTLRADTSKAGRQRYQETMTMLRAIYSQGSHTQHSLVILSQTALVKDLDISESDKTNFVEVVLREQVPLFLSQQKGQADKKTLYRRVNEMQSRYAYYCAIRSPEGLEVQPIPNLSPWGAKRNYGESESTETLGKLSNDSARRQSVPRQTKLKKMATRKGGQDDEAKEEANQSAIDNQASKMAFGLDAQGRVVSQPTESDKAQANGRTEVQPTDSSSATGNGRTEVQPTDSSSATGNGRTEVQPTDSPSATGNGRTEVQPTDSSSATGNGRTEVQPTDSSSATGNGRTEVQPTKRQSEVDESIISLKGTVNQADREAVLLMARLMYGPRVISDRRLIEELNITGTSQVRTKRLRERLAEFEDKSS